MPDRLKVLTSLGRTICGEYLDGAGFHPVLVTGGKLINNIYGWGAKTMLARDISALDTPHSIALSPRSMNLNIKAYRVVSSTIAITECAIGIR